MAGAESGKVTPVDADIKSPPRRSSSSSSASSRSKASTASTWLAQGGTGVDVAVVVVSSTQGKSLTAGGWECMLQSQLGAAKAVIQARSRVHRGGRWRD